MLYSIGTATHVRLAAYDVRGRLVRTLFAGHLGAGSYETSWDQRDAGGRRLARGVYVLRLQAGATSATRKIALVRD